MEAEHLSRRDSFEDVSFQLHKGEILAFTGLQSSGRDFLADALFGVTPHTGKPMKSRASPCSAAVHPRIYAKQGVAMVPRSRKERGIHNDLSIIR